MPEFLRLITVNKTLGTFVKAAAAGSLLHIFRLATGFARSKIVAISFGPIGVGLVSQANQLLLLGSSLGNLCLGPSIINLLAPPDQQKRERILRTAFSIHLILALLILIFGILFLNPLTRFVFGDEKYSSITLAILIAIPFLSFSSGYFQSIFFGFNQYSLFVRATIIALILGFVAFLMMASRWGLMGVVGSLTTGAILLSLIYFFFCLRLTSIHSLVRWGVERPELSAIFSFGLVSLILGLTEYSSNLIIRREILLRLGATANGILQVPIAMTSYLTPFVVNGLWGRLYPKVSASRNSPEAWHELKSATSLSLLLTTGIILCLLASREFFIRAAYSSDFLDASRLMSVQLVGDFFFLAAAPLLIFILGIAQLRLYLIAWGVFYAIQMTGTILFIDRWGIIASPIAYLVASCAQVFICLIWIGFKNGFENNKKIISMTMICACLVIMQSLLCSRATSIGLTILVPLIYLFAIGMNYKALLR